MSAPKFTPGPWSVEIHGDEYDTVFSSSGFCPFGACGCCNSPWMNGDDDEQKAANAALIAAAPELYAALVETLDALLTHIDADDCQSFLARVNGALAKARGEA